MYIFIKITKLFNLDLKHELRLDNVYIVRRDFTIRVGKKFIPTNNLGKLYEYETVINQSPYHLEYVNKFEYIENTFNFDNITINGNVASVKIKPDTLYEAYTTILLNENRLLQKLEKAFKIRNLNFITTKTTTGYKYIKYVKENARVPIPTIRAVYKGSSIRFDIRNEKDVYPAVKACCRYLTFVTGVKYPDEPDITRSLVMFKGSESTKVSKLYKVLLDDGKTHLVVSESPEITHINGTLVLVKQLVTMLNVDVTDIPGIIVL